MGTGQLSGSHELLSNLLLGQTWCVGGLFLSALVGNITRRVAFIHIMILFTRLLDLVKKKT